MRVLEPDRNAPRRNTTLEVDVTMDAIPPQDDFVLELSAFKEWVPAVRVFAAAVAAAHSASPDEVSDVKLAVSEIASAIVTATPGVSLELRVQVEGGRLTFSVGPWSGAGPSDELNPWDIVTALFESAHIDGGRAMFSVAVSEAS